MTHATVLATLCSLAIRPIAAADTTPANTGRMETAVAVPATEARAAAVGWSITTTSRPTPGSRTPGPSGAMHIPPTLDARVTETPRSPRWESRPAERR